MHSLVHSFTPYILGPLSGPRLLVPLGRDSFSFSYILTPVHGGSTSFFFVLSSVRFQVILCHHFADLFPALTDFSSRLSEADANLVSAASKTSTVEVVGLEDKVAVVGIIVVKK